MNHPTNPNFVVLHFHGFETFNDIESIVNHEVATMVQDDPETQDEIKITIERMAKPKESAVAQWLK